MVTIVLIMEQTCKLQITITKLLINYIFLFRNYLRTSSSTIHPNTGRSYWLGEFKFITVHNCVRL